MGGEISAAEGGPDGGKKGGSGHLTNFDSSFLEIMGGPYDFSDKTRKHASQLSYLEDVPLRESFDGRRSTDTS